MLPTTPANSRTLRILVVDDDPIFRSLAASKLVRLAHEVIEVEDGAAAWSKLAHEKFHLALVDLEMPHLKGDELIRCIRGHPRTRHIPVIVVTSRNDTEAIRACLEAGATSFLTKPLNWSMFGNHIDYLLHLYKIGEDGRRAQEEASQTVAAIGGLVSEFSGEVMRATARISADARAILDASRRPGSEVRVTAMLEALIARIDMARETLADAATGIEQAATSGRESGPEPAGFAARRAS
jgi:CheY-like chemotaxis protein